MNFHHNSTWVAAKGAAVSVAGSADCATCGIESEFVDGKSTCNVLKKQFSRWDAD